MYIIRCYNDKESFIKIGKTFRTIKDRFYKIREMPYTYEVLKVIEGDALEVSKIEHTLHKINKDFRYSPILKFSGATECFSELKEETFAY